MNQELALKVLSQIMAWPDERAREEFQWLRLMARLKYDGYRDFQAGMRFIESLATWLQQFEAGERETAYAFVRRSLVYVGPGEMQRLVEQFYPRFVRNRLLETVAAERSLPAHRVFADPDAYAAVQRLLRQTLFMGLSDGARIDILRHVNTGLLSNEQLVIATQVDKDKWKDLLENLRGDLKDPSAQFRFVYLIDDFAGTGTSCLRWNEAKKKWSGKLIRFHESLEGVAAPGSPDRPLADAWDLCVHHYIASHAAAAALEERITKARTDLGGAGYARAIHASFGAVLPADMPINASGGLHTDFLALTQKYYDPVLRTKHTDVGGALHLGLGYGACALPLVLDHNTPNNSVALLWAETRGEAREGQSASAMRPLFRRRQRHVE